MDTIDPMVVRSPLGWAPTPELGARRILRWTVAVVVGCIVLAAAILVEIPYYAIAPGTARQVNDLIVVPGDRAVPPQGRVLLATVAVRRVSTLEAIQGWLDPDISVVPEDRVLGDGGRGDFARDNRVLMEGSKDAAVLVALRRLGFPVAEQGTGAVVIDVRPGSPAAGRLVAGDVVTAVDGTPTTLTQSLVDAIASRPSGAEVRLTVEGAAGAVREQPVVVGAAPGAPPTAGGFLGVTLRTRGLTYDMPFDVTIDSGRIGGPSAGLAFTLGLLDALTPGELTGGARVAVTGTIQLDGTVGDVGGVTQKTAAVRAAGADYFLVPPGEFQEAKARAGSRMKVRRVATLDEAIAALGDLGGDGLPAPVSRLAAA